MRKLLPLFSILALALWLAFNFELIKLGTTSKNKRIGTIVSGKLKQMPGQFIHGHVELFTVHSEFADQKLLYSYLDSEFRQNLKEKLEFAFHAVVGDQNKKIKASLVNLTADNIQHHYSFTHDFFCKKDVQNNLFELSPYNGKSASGRIQLIWKDSGLAASSKEIFAKGAQRHYAVLSGHTSTKGLENFEIEFNQDFVLHGLPMNMNEFSVKLDFKRQNDLKPNIKVEAAKKRIELDANSRDFQIPFLVSRLYDLNLNFTGLHDCLEILLLKDGKIHSTHATFPNSTQAGNANRRLSLQLEKGEYELIGHSNHQNSSKGLNLYAQLKFNITEPVSKDIDVAASEGSQVAVKLSSKDRKYGAGYGIVLLLEKSKIKIMRKTDENGIAHFAGIAPHSAFSIKGVPDRKFTAEENGKTLEVVMNIP